MSGPAILLVLALAAGFVATGTGLAFVSEPDGPDARGRRIGWAAIAAGCLVHLTVIVAVMP